MMDKKIIAKSLFVLLSLLSACWTGCSAKTRCVEPKEKQANPVDMVLNQLNQKTKQLKYYQAQVEYKIIQPVFESTTLRKGALYYAKKDEKSKLRVDFKTLKQDDEEEQKYREEFIFDGVWLTHINYQIKQVRLHQLAEPNKPVDAFELAARNLPIVGFAKIEDLKKQFDIKLIEQEKGPTPVFSAELVPEGAVIQDFIQLHLKVKPDSVYKDDYISIDFWIDKKLGLPARINAVSTEQDIHQIKLLKPQVNKQIEQDIFDFKVPADFGKEIIPLKKKD
jgi:outer membrane lipoprotein-sorting protein